MCFGGKKQINASLEMCSAAWRNYVCHKQNYNTKKKTCDDDTPCLSVVIGPHVK